MANLLVTSFGKSAVLSFHHVQIMPMVGSVEVHSLKIGTICINDVLFMSIKRYI